MTEKKDLKNNLFGKFCFTFCNLKNIGLILFVVLLGLTTPVLAQNPTMVEIIPLAEKIGVGQTIQVRVDIQNIESLYGYDLKIRFDPQIMSVVDADPNLTGNQVNYGTFLDPGLVVMNMVDEETGTLRVVLSQKNPSQPKTGSGTLLVILFEARRSGETEISVEESIFSDASGNSIPVENLAGRITVVEESVPGNQPTVEVINPQDQIQLVQAGQTQQENQSMPVTAGSTATPIPQPVVEKTTAAEQTLPAQSATPTVELPAAEKELTADTESPVEKTQFTISPPLYFLGGLLIVTVIAGIFFWRSRQG